MLFLFVYLATVFLFLLLRKALGHWGYGLVGACFFWLSPCFFAESFCNVKDVGFLAAFIIGLYFLFRSIERPNLRRSVLVGGFSAFAAAVRILGGVFTLFAFGFSLSRVIRRKISVKSFILTMAAMVIFILSFRCSFLSSFLVQSIQFLPGGALSQMSHYPWNDSVLFLGKIIKATELPWYYLPVWIFCIYPFANNPSFPGRHCVGWHTVLLPRQES